MEQCIIIVWTFGGGGTLYRDWENVICCGLPLSDGGSIIQNLFGGDKDILVDEVDAIAKQHQKELVHEATEGRA